MTEKQLTGTQLNTLLSKLVDSFIIDQNPSALDDMQSEILSDPNQRAEATDTLINYIEHNREFI